MNGGAEVIGPHLPNSSLASGPIQPRKGILGSEAWTETANPKKIRKNFEVIPAWPGGPLREFAKVRPHRNWGIPHASGQYANQYVCKSLPEASFRRVRAGMALWHLPDAEARKT